MTHDDLEPMDADLKALLAIKKTLPDPSPEVRARVFASVAANVALVAGGSGGPSASGHAARLVSAHPFASVLGALVIGAAGGAIVRGSVPTKARVVYVDRPAAPPLANEAPREVPAAPEPAPTVSAIPSPLATTPARPRRPASDSSIEGERLAAERTLLDVARAALSRGEAAKAVEAAERHAQEFPSGALAEEREAIVIRALVQAGRGDEARARAAQFHARFPESIFGRAIDAALASIP
jgi:hypothetical protein